jgi:hypothetical protein
MGGFLPRLVQPAARSPEREGGYIPHRRVAASGASAAAGHQGGANRAGVAAGSWRRSNAAWRDHWRHRASARRGARDRRPGPPPTAHSPRASAVRSPSHRQPCRRRTRHAPGRAVPERAPRDRPTRRLRLQPGQRHQANALHRRRQAVDRRRGHSPGGCLDRGGRRADRPWPVRRAGPRPSSEGSFGNASTFRLAGLAAGAALLATGLLHLLLVSTPRPGQFFTWIVALATIAAALAPFLTDADLGEKVRGVCPSSSWCSP